MKTLDMSPHHLQTIHRLNELAKSPDFWVAVGVAAFSLVAYVWGV